MKPGARALHLVSRSRSLSRRTFCRSFSHLRHWVYFDPGRRFTLCPCIRCPRLHRPPFLAGIAKHHDRNKQHVNHEYRDRDTPRTTPRRIVSGLPDRFAAAVLRTIHPVPLVQIAHALFSEFLMPAVLFMTQCALDVNGQKESRPGARIRDQGGFLRFALTRAVIAGRG